jgi:hypothetical protein
MSKEMCEGRGRNGESDKYGQNRTEEEVIYFTYVIYNYAAP